MGPRLTASVRSNANGLAVAMRSVVRGRGCGMANKGQCLSGAKRLNREEPCIPINPRQGVVVTYTQPPNI